MTTTQISDPGTSPSSTQPGTTTALGSRIVRTIQARPRRALLAVFLFVLVAGALGGPVAGALDSDGGFVPDSADSVRAHDELTDAAGHSPTAGIIALVRTPAGPGDQAEVDAVTDTLAGLDGVATATQAGVAQDGSSALVAAVVSADADPEDVAQEAIDTFADNSSVTVGGSAVIGPQIGERVGEDLGRAEMLAFPILLLLSLLFFGGRAAVLPMVVGVTTVLGTFLALSGINQVYGLSVFALNLVIGLGLGLAIDYTLFLVSRYREELDRQGATVGAVLTTMRTAGRTVAFSAATVAVALITLTVFPMGFLKSMGIAGAVVAVVAAVAALVVSPAIFGLWGAKLARKRRRDDEAEGRWYRLSHAVMRRPGAIAAVTAVVMLALAAPALRVAWTPVDSSVVPTDLSSRVVADAIEADYGGTGTTPVLAAIETDDAGRAERFADAASQLPGVTAPAAPVEVGPGMWQLDLSVSGDPSGESAQQVVTEVRQVADDQGIDVLVGGAAAEFVDQQAAIGDGLPLAIGLMILLTMLVLWLMTGSVVLPVKAVVMNVLTVGVALGALTFVYQDGRLTGLLGYTPNGGIEPTDFLVAAAVVFALSTDYGVFLLGRIKEARDSGLPEREAVAVGLGRTGSVVTAAAILLAVAIGAFSTSSISFIQQIGIATAVGVLVDAFVVRSLLVPSLMGLLGKWNWWAPMPLRRLHDRIGFTESEPDAPGPQPVPGEPAANH
ncbi:MMPL family transporter [Nocardioides sp. GXZ039]|uniref:MMPL family transporter n=1 Tax=Nocardioides sp. GXZ039 TaxID=3136018 RepID=UPI0030F3F515